MKTRTSRLYVACCLQEIAPRLKKTDPMATEKKPGRSRRRKRYNGVYKQKRRRHRENTRAHHSGDLSLVAAEGVLEVLSNNRGYLRSAKHRYCPNEQDVFVPPEIIKKLKLKTGCEIKGKASSNKKTHRLQSVESVMGISPEEFHLLTPFSQLTCIDPIECFDLDRSNDPSLRIIDLITPIGKGQRSMIVASPRTGKTILLKKLAGAITDFHSDVHLIVLLVDERPEEVTDFKRSVNAEVIYSSNDEPPSQHLRVVEMVLERARRMVEVGVDVVILLDSLTRVARAYNSQTKDRGRTLSGGLGARAMQKPREFFGAARKVEDGASLTIVATALIDTGSRMDDVIFEEFKGTGNMELVLHRGLAEQRIWPAIDIKKSGTRKEEKLRSQEAQQKVDLVRRALSAQSPQDALKVLLNKIEKTPSNKEFLRMLKA